MEGSSDHMNVENLDRKRKRVRGVRVEGHNNNEIPLFSLLKGPWSSEEDEILSAYVKEHGEGDWNKIQRVTNLRRCGKSCRLRWVNHLRADLKKDAFSEEEERTVVEIHARIGNKWSHMAKQLPGRTDNEIKNFWHTRAKRLQKAGLPLYPSDISATVEQEGRDDRTSETEDKQITDEPQIMPELNLSFSSYPQELFNYLLSILPARTKPTSGTINPPSYSVSNSTMQTNILEPNNPFSGLHGFVPFNDQHINYAMEEYPEQNRYLPSACNTTLVEPQQYIGPNYIVLLTGPHSTHQIVNDLEVPSFQVSETQNPWNPLPSLEALDGGLPLAHQTSTMNQFETPLLDQQTLYTSVMANNMLGNSFPIPQQTQWDAQGNLNCPSCDSNGAYTRERNPVNVGMSEKCQSTQTMIGYDTPVEEDNQGASSPDSFMEAFDNMSLPSEPETLSELDFEEPEEIMSKIEHQLTKENLN